MRLIKLSVVIPTYKEAENVRLLIPRIYRVLKRNRINAEIIIIDDNSNDGIEDVVLMYVKQLINITLIVRVEQSGLATAWLKGIQTARGEYVVVMDADLCHDPKYFLPMLERLKDYDMVIGSRRIPGMYVKMPGKSILSENTSKFGQFLFRKFYKIDIYDSSHSFRMFKRKKLLKTINNLHSDGNVIMIELTLKAIRNGLRVIEIPVTYGMRVHGETKLKLFEQGLLFVKALIHLNGRFR